jgi:L-ascorbate metabolism protein UlaG (beta-lactamase superfamily)
VFILTKLLYQGHSSFRITSKEGLVIYIDPYAGRGYDLPADLILVTHQHQDHNQIKLVQLKSDGKVIQNFDLHPIDGSYLSSEFKGIKVTAVPAYNKNHPKEHGVGYIIFVDEFVIYHSGDTSYIVEMMDLASYDIDYALLCGDGKYNMNIKESASCAEVIGAKHNVPIHLAPGELFDSLLASMWKAPNKKIIVPGVEILLKK